MTDISLQEAIAELRRVSATVENPWTGDDFAMNGMIEPVDRAIAAILNAVLSGDLIPRADAELAVAEAIRRAAEEAASEGWPGENRLGVSEREEGAMDCANRIETAIFALAPADALAEVQRLREAVEALVAVLDRNDKKGPIPDVEMFFCWLAAQDVRAAFRKIAPKGEAT